MIGSVVEGQRDMAGAALSGQPGHDPVAQRPEGGERRRGMDRCHGGQPHTRGDDTGLAQDCHTGAACHRSYLSRMLCATPAI